MEHPYTKHMNTIKYFHTFLGAMIDNEEQNDLEEVEFLSNYINRYYSEYTKWCEEYSCGSSTESSDEEDNKSNDNEDDNDEDDNDEDNNDEDNHLKNFNELYKQYFNNTNREKKTQLPEHLKNFIKNINDNSNILLYKKNNTSVNRCHRYLNNLNKY